MRKTRCPTAPVEFKISYGVHPGRPAREIFIAAHPGRLELEIYPRKRCARRFSNLWKINNSFCIAIASSLTSFRNPRNVGKYDTIGYMFYVCLVYKENSYKKRHIMLVCLNTILVSRQTDGFLVSRQTDGFLVSRKNDGSLVSSALLGSRFSVVGIR